MQLESRQQLLPCSRCGQIKGWYEKRVCKYTQYFEANGESLDASNMERVRGGDRCYCNSCDKDITDQIKMVD